MKRNLVIDCMKGIGIVLVVISHSISRHIGYQSNIVDFSIFCGIQSFFMLMFFMISGYLIYGRSKSNDWTYKRVVSFLIPIFVFMVLYWVFNASTYENMSFGFYMKAQLLSGSGLTVTWYLWVLILMYLVTYLAENIRKVNPVFTLFAVIVLLNVLPIGYLNIESMKWYGLFFSTGYAIRYYSSKFEKLSKFGYAGIIVFPVLGYFTQWTVHYQSQYMFAGYANIRELIFRDPVSLLILAGMAFSGILFVYGLSKVIVRIKYVNRVFSYLGTISLGIYLLHILFVRILNSESYWYSACIALGSSIVIYEVAKRFNVTNFVFGQGKYVDWIVNKIVCKKLVEL